MRTPLPTWMATVCPSVSTKELPLLVEALEDALDDDDEKRRGRLFLVVVVGVWAPRGLPTGCRKIFWTRNFMTALRRRIAILERGFAAFSSGARPS